MPDTPTPTKPLDRNKPFKRINNDQFLPAKLKQPDGDGKACGCHTPDEFGNVDDDFLKDLDDLLPADLFHAITALDDLLTTVNNILSIFNNPLLQFFPVIGQIGLVAKGIVAVIQGVIHTIRTTIDDFFKSIGRQMLDRAGRVMPQWVPVKKGAPSDEVGSDQLVEMEGLASRSFGNPCDVPFFQWHHWFDWNVQVAPEPDYVQARSASPTVNPPNQTKFAAGDKPVALDNPFEVQIDPGILFTAARQKLAYDNGFRSQVLKGKRADILEANDGPFLLADWCWPQTGSFFWAAGRHVYDCSRVTDSKDTPRMCAMINPARAFATARWRADTLPGQVHPFNVPVIQFMFFASKKGGYVDFKDDTTQDYEFILDLPPAPGGSRSPFHIRDTRGEPRNTIVLSNVLLFKVEPLQLTDAELLTPQWEPIVGDDPTQPPKQVKIKVPLKSSPSSVDQSGFIITFGWLDSDGSQAASVKMCEVSISAFSGRHKSRDDIAETVRDRFDKAIKALKDDVDKRIQDMSFDVPPLGHVVIAKIGIPGIAPHLGQDIINELKKAVNSAIDGIVDLIVKAIPGGDEEWLLRVGVNGRWRNGYQPSVGKAEQDGSGNDKPIPLQNALSFGEIPLGPDDTLTITVNGVEFDPVEDMMMIGRNDVNPGQDKFSRFIEKDFKKDRSAISWNDIVQAPTPKWKRLVEQYVVKVMKETDLLGLDGDPLGFIEPGTPGNTLGQSNPLLMKGLPEGSTDFTLPPSKLARFAHSVPDQQILAENPGTDDYRLFGHISVKKQDTKKK